MYQRNIGLFVIIITCSTTVTTICSSIFNTQTTTTIWMIALFLKSLWRDCYVIIMFHHNLSLETLCDDDSTKNWCNNQVMVPLTFAAYTVGDPAKNWDQWRLDCLSDYTVAQAFMMYGLFWKYHATLYCVYGVFVQIPWWSSQQFTSHTTKHCSVYQFLLVLI